MNSLSTMLNFSFRPDKYDFWTIYEAIKKYYPIGLNSSNVIDLHYSGTAALQQIVVENIHDSNNFKKRWTDFTKNIENDLNKPIVGTTFGQAPSFSSFVSLDIKGSEGCLHRKELHFSVSLIGEFFQIYGLDITELVDMVGNSRCQATNAVTISPHGEFKETFSYIEHILQEKYPTYRLVPFGFGQTIINGLQIHYSNHTICTINMAIFNDHINNNNVPSYARGDEYYGVNKWKKNNSSS